MTDMLTSTDLSNSAYALNKTDINHEYLEQKLENVKDKQGFIGNIWNDFKEAFDG